MTGSQEVTSSSLVRSTMQTVGIPTVFAFFGVVGFGWKWLDKSSYARRPKPLKNQCFEGVSSNVVAIRVKCRSEVFVPKLRLNDQIIDPISMHLGCAGLPCLVQTPSRYTDLITVFVDRLTEGRIQTAILFIDSEYASVCRHAQSDSFLPDPFDYLQGRRDNIHGPPTLDILEPAFKAFHIVTV